MVSVVYNKINDKNLLFDKFKYIIINYYLY